MINEIHFTCFNQWIDIKILGQFVASSYVIMQCTREGWLYYVRWKMYFNLYVPFYLRVLACGNVWYADIIMILNSPWRLRLWEFHIWPRTPGFIYPQPIFTIVNQFRPQTDNALPFCNWSALWYVINYRHKSTTTTINYY